MIRVVPGGMVVASLILLVIPAVRAESTPNEPAMKAVMLAQEAAPEGSQPDPQEEEPTVEARAAELLEEMARYIQSADQFTFRADVHYDDIALGNVKVEYGATIDVGVRRPDRLRAEYMGDQSERRFWCDGETVTLYAASKDVYGTIPARDTIDATMDGIREEYGVAIPLADLVYNDLLSSVGENVLFGFYVGLHDVGDRRCHHLLFIQEDVHWQVWIEDGKQLVPRKIVITYVTEPGEPQYTAVFDDWDFSPRLADRYFVADVPEGTQKIDFLPVEREEKTEKR